MILDSALLFFVTLGAGMSVKLLPGMKSSQLKMLLVFSGAYLFSITFVHILPAVFEETQSIGNSGLFVLAGFFFQMVLEYFTSGIEHGHMHEHHHTSEHTVTRTFTLLIALGIHSFMEGSILAYPVEGHHHDSLPLLGGILLHKVPAAVALMSFLVCQEKPSRYAWVLLVIFALMSPLGLILSEYLHAGSILSKDSFLILMALVAGNFLYISTIILFESSPGHSQNLRKLSIILLGALTAILIELFL